MSRGWRPLVIVSALVIAVGSVSCSARSESDDQPAPTMREAETSGDPGPSDPAERRLLVAPGACPDATGYASAAAGLLSIGDFSAESVRPLEPGQDGHKVWVASQRPGHDDATVTVTDPRGHSLIDRRPSGESWVDGVAQFYPGTVRTTMTGSYRLEATVGPDTICVRVHYREH